MLGAGTTNMNNTTTISVPVLASAWDVAQLVNNVDPDWDALLAGDENDDMLGAAKVIMGAISIHAYHRRTQLKAA